MPPGSPKPDRIYQRDDAGGICHDWQPSPWLTIYFRAEQVRRERTGLHARVEINCHRARQNRDTLETVLDFRLLAYDTFNVGRQEDRRRLANHAWKALATRDDTIDQDVVTEPVLQEQLSLFCFELEAGWLGQWGVEEITPDETQSSQHWYLRPYLLKGAGTIAYAAPEAGKSYWMYLLAQSLQHASKAHGPWQIDRPCRVLVVDLERSRDSIKRRIWGVNRALSLPHDAGLPLLSARGQPLATIAQAIDRQAASDRPDVLFLDSISRSGMGSLIEDTTAMGIVDTMNRVAETWFALGHMPRNDKDHLFGSVHFDAGADLMVEVKRQATDDGFGQSLRIVKGNDIAKPKAPEYLRWVFDEDGLLVVVPSRPQDLPELAAANGTKEPPLKQLKDYVMGVGRTTTSGAADALGLDVGFVSRMLSGPGFTKAGDGLGRIGREVWYGVRSDL